MSRLTPFQQQIFENHLAAKRSKSWDYTEKIDGTKADFIALLKGGKTFFNMWDTLEYKCLSMVDLLMVSGLEVMPDTYKRKMCKGLRDLLNELGIV